MRLRQTLQQIKQITLRKNAPTVKPSTDHSQPLPGTLLLAMMVGVGSLTALLTHETIDRVRAGGSSPALLALAGPSTTDSQAASTVQPVFNPVAYPDLVSEQEAAAFEAELAESQDAATPVRDVVSGVYDATVSFNGRKLRAVKQMKMLTTAYSPDAQSCGIWADGITASGKSVWTNGGNLVAADTRLLPFGTIVTIPGYNNNQPVQVLDRGGKIKGHRLDLLYPTHNIALQWGVQKLDIVVWEYAD